MPKFVALCIDKPDAAEVRAAARSAHIDYIEAARDRILLVGPLLTEQDTLAGSMFLIEAEDIAAARAFVAADPFSSAGLFETVTVSRFRPHLGTLV